MVTNETAIAWSDLTFKVKPFFWSEEKTILNKLYGSVEFGALTALIGPSGAGKTTLLDCIYGKRSSSLDCETKFYVNSNRTIWPCYVAQHEDQYLIMCLTVKENLMFASKLKNSDLNSNTCAIDHELNIKNVMDELLISDVCDLRVNCCSGGQKKRLTIAMEMVKSIKPNFLCIDEPTTGLDSNVAEVVMKILAKLAKRHNLAIITSIHQPNQEILMIFDKLYVMAKGGECIYNGPPDTIAKNLTKHRIELIENQIPIEQLLKLGSLPIDNQNLKQLIESTRESASSSLLKLCQDHTTMSENGLNRPNKSFNLSNMWNIMLRTMIQLYLRQWKTLILQFVFYIGYALFAVKVFREDIGKPSACFNSSKISNGSCIENMEQDTLLFQNQNFLFFILLMVQLIHLCITALKYCKETKLFCHEHRNSWYSTGSYYCGKAIVEIVPTIFFGATYGFVLYYGSGQLLEKERLLAFVLITTLGFIISEAIGQTIGTLYQNNPQSAIMAALGTGVVMGLFSNYFIRVSELSLPLQYLSEFSFSKFIFNSALLLVYGNNRCSAQESSSILLKYNLTNQLLEPSFYKLGIYVIASRILTFVCLFWRTEPRTYLRWFTHQTGGSIETEERYQNKRRSMHSESNNIPMNNLTRRFSTFQQMASRRMSTVSRRTSWVARRLSKINLRRPSIYNCSDDLVLGWDFKTSEEEPKKIMSIAWTDLTLCIPKDLFNDQKIILDHINGFFEFGTINALMGPSGAGKTTLLNCFNGLYNGFLTDQTTVLLSKYRKIRTCFITQNQKDHILSGLTSKQALTYASKLKNSDKSFNHKKNVEDIMDEFFITNTSDTNVENCSGGEQKRLAIAMELTANLKPSLLCIDEPTSGLDSNVAEIVIKCLKRLSINHNICVITSIHQPNNDLLFMFDKLYVLSKCGHCIYSGRPQQLSQHLSNCGIVCSKRQFPIEVLLKYSYNESNNTNVEKMVQKTKLMEKGLIASRSPNELNLIPDHIKRVSKRFYLRDLWLLIQRELTYNLQYYWKIHLLQFVVFMISGLLARLLYDPKIGIPSGCVSLDDDFGNCGKTEAKLEEENLLATNLNFNLFIIFSLVLITSSTTILSFAMHMRLFLNEQRNSMQ